MLIGIAKSGYEYYAEDVLSRLFELEEAAIDEGGEPSADIQDLLAGIAANKGKITCSRIVAMAIRHLNNKDILAEIAKNEKSRYCSCCAKAAGYQIKRLNCETFCDDVGYGGSHQSYAYEKMDKLCGLANMGIDMRLEDVGCG